MPETSATLLERLRDRGDALAWRRLVELYTPLIQGWLRRAFLQASDLDDMVQEVLGVVVREFDGFRHNEQPGAFRGWLRLITVHRLRNFWRAQQTLPQTAGPPHLAVLLDQLEDPASDLSRLWDQEHDRHVVGRLLDLIEPEFAPSTWRAFRRLVLDEQSPEAVAAELGLTVNAVFIAKSRVLQRLRRETRGLTGQ
jgi:RNA polymerase sigma factor (sigma-70 family)